MWKYATLLVAFPAVGVAIWNTERQEHLNPYKRPEFQTYDHLRLRTKVVHYSLPNKQKSNFRVKLYLHLKFLCKVFKFLIIIYL